VKGHVSTEVTARTSLRRPGWLTLGGGRSSGIRGSSSGSSSSGSSSSGSSRSKACKVDGAARLPEHPYLCCSCTRPSVLYKGRHVLQRAPTKEAAARAVVERRHSHVVTKQECW
jgi:hypothetical protein